MRKRQCTEHRRALMDGGDGVDEVYEEIVVQLITKVLAAVRKKIRVCFCQSDF